MPSGQISLDRLPDYLLKTMPKSRVSTRAQSLMLCRYFHDDKAVDVVICENVTSSRNRTLPTVWGEWVDRTHTDHDEARKSVIGLTDRLARRGYLPLTTVPLILPVGETDLRHFRNELKPPRQILDYGSELLDGITSWREEEYKRVSAIATAGGPPAPAVPPRPVMPVPAATAPPGGIRYPDGGYTVATGTMSDVMSRLRNRAAEMKRAELEAEKI